MSKYVKKSREESLLILREYLMSDSTKRSIQLKYGLEPNWICRNLIKFAIADKKPNVRMKKLPGNVTVEKTYCESDRDALLRRIQELEVTLLVDVIYVLLVFLIVLPILEKRLFEVRY